MAESIGSRRWWHPERLAARRGNLAERARIKRALSDWFDSEGFSEVETPALQVSPGLEPHLSAFETVLLPPGRGGAAPVTRYLHTSPEFAMKKILAAGEPRIWQLCPVFRNAEGARTHAPEFRMLEWYRAGDPVDRLHDDCRALLRAALPGPGRYRFRGKESDPHADWQVITVEQAFLDYAGVDLGPTFRGRADEPDTAALRAAAAEIGVRTDTEDRWDDVFFRIFAERIEPHLGHPAPTLLTGYPLTMAALARQDPRDPALAERFELYVCGLELANAFGELTDPAEQRRRFEADMALKQALYGETYPIDEDFIAALEIMPAASGIALGFDRLVMLACGADDIDDVLWAPVDRGRDAAG